MKQPWDQQLEDKYRDHDLVLTDIPQKDISTIKGVAVNNFVLSAEADAAKLTIAAFMAYLTQQGFRITKVKK